MNLGIREVSDAVRAQVWREVFDSMRQARKNPTTGGASWLGDPWRSILFNWHVYHRNAFADDFTPHADKQNKKVREIFEYGDYIKFFAFVEFVIRDDNCPPRLPQRINRALERTGAAYRIIDQTVMPVASEEDIQAIQQTFTLLRYGRFTGARTHLRNAAEELTAGHFADSVRESIHAVESAARVLSPGTKTLGPALTALEKTGTIHAGLKAGLGSLYGFASDESGIRHPLLDQGDPNVSEADALYMFGACAAFLTYLSLKVPEAAKLFGTDE